MRFDAVCVIQARMESRRLPGKVLKPLHGKPLLWHLIHRLAKLPILETVVALSDARESIPLENWLVTNGFPYFKGHATDLYQRFSDGLRHKKCTQLIRVTADNPLTDPNLIEAGLQAMDEESLDYVWMDNCPVGLGCDIFRADSFFAKAEKAMTAEEKEHLVYLFRNDPLMKGRGIPSGYPKGSNKIRLTVDTEEDYLKMQGLFEKFCGKNFEIDINEIVLHEWRQTQ